jgi:hypothetical protein
MGNIGSGFNPNLAEKRNGIMDVGRKEGKGIEIKEKEAIDRDDREGRNER